MENVLQLPQQPAPNTCGGCLQTMPDASYLHDGLCNHCTFEKEKHATRAKIWNFVSEHGQHGVLLESELDELIAIATEPHNKQIKNLTTGLINFSKSVQSATQKNHDLALLSNTLVNGLLQIVETLGAPPYQVARTHAMNALGKAGLLKSEQPANGRIILPGGRR